MLVFQCLGATLDKNFLILNIIGIVQVEAPNGRVYFRPTDNLTPKDSLRVARFRYTFAVVLDLIGYPIQVVCDFDEAKLRRENRWFNNNTKAYRFTGTGKID